MGVAVAGRADWRVREPVQVGASDAGDAGVQRLQQVVAAWRRQPVMRRLGVKRRVVARLRMVDRVVLVTVRVHDRLVHGVR